MTTNTATIPLKELLALNLLASVNETRYEINGVHIEAKPGQVLIVATDGRRLGMLRSAGETESTFTATIPRGALDFLKRMELGDAECAVSMEAGGRLRLRVKDRCPADVGAVDIETEAIQKAFPNWRAVMPDGPCAPCAKIGLNREYLASWAAVGELLGFDEAVVFLLRDELGPVEVVFAGYPQFRGLLMPMRTHREDVFERPEWMKAAAAV